MNETFWLPIKYHEFYDVPRSIVVQHNNVLYLLESSFNDNTDEYSSVFKVYRLPIELWDQLDTLDMRSWNDLRLAGVYIGEVPVANVELDETKRAFLHKSTFQVLGL